MSILNKYTERRDPRTGRTPNKAEYRMPAVTRADKKAAFNLVQDPLVKAYMYGNINESTMSVLSKLDGFESFTQDMADDLLAEVEIA